MDSRRPKNSKNNFDRTILDKQVDKIFETGRQFVAGVSGTRPGKKRNNDFQGISRRNVKNVGRWVTDKVESFFDDEFDDWDDNYNSFEEYKDNKSFIRQSRSNEFDKPLSKRPLEALSLRQPYIQQKNEQKKLPYGQLNSFEEWPDKDLRVDRWQRDYKKNNNEPFNNENTRKGSSQGRSLPRSRRRRI